MDYIVHILIFISIFSILSLSLNLLVGYTGLLSVNHAAFFGIGAYSMAIFVTEVNTNFFLAMLGGIIIAAVVSFFVGLVLNRFQGDYYVLVSVAFNAIAYSVFLNWEQLTHGPLGIPGISRPRLLEIDFSDNFVFLILSVVTLLIIYVICEALVNSHYGRVLKAIREDEMAISIFGYNTFYYKLSIFIVSAAMASVAGALFASYVTFIDPSTFNINDSIFLIAIVVLGGLASLEGSLLGAFFLTFLPELLRFVGFPVELAAQLRQVVYGLILILLMLYKPEGILGKFRL